MLAIAGITRICSRALSLTSNGASKLAVAPLRAGVVRGNAKVVRREYKTNSDVFRPIEWNAKNIGLLATAGVGMAGFGALLHHACSVDATSPLLKSQFWPQLATQYLRTTYMYFGAGLAVSAVTAMQLIRTNFVHRMMGANPLAVFVGSLVAAVASSAIVQTLPYKPGFNMKQLAYMGHCAIIGAIISPAVLMGGTLVARAAMYTAFGLGGLTLMAYMAPEDRFLSWGGPLSIGLCGLVAVCLGSVFFPATPMLHNAISVASLALFSGFILHDTQLIHKKAEVAAYQRVQYDPINSSLGIYMSTINMFISILNLLQNRKSR